jgi:hypothetical protein
MLASAGSFHLRGDFCVFSRDFFMGRKRANSREGIGNEKSEAQVALVLSRVAEGFSRSQTEGELCRVFGLGVRRARDVYRLALDGLAVRDAGERCRLRSAIVQALYFQIRDCALDMDLVSQEIERFRDCLRQKEDLERELLGCVEGGKKDKLLMASLELRLSFLPRLPIGGVAGLIEGRNKVRDRSIRLLAELARVQGVYGDMPIIVAVQTLLDNGLLSAAAAADILCYVEGLESVREISQR